MPRLSLACSFLVVLLSSHCVRVESTPLDDYVNKPDPTYKYEDLGNPWRGDGYTSYFINLTSQTWLSGKQLAKKSDQVVSVLKYSKGTAAKITYSPPHAWLQHGAGAWPP